MGEVFSMAFSWQADNYDMVNTWQHQKYMATPKILQFDWRWRCVDSLVIS
jgi:hypothetical protein